MRLCSRCHRGSGFTYVELLVGLVIAALLFAPAYRFAASVLGRRAADTWRGDEADMALDVLARDVRCATADAREVPFFAHAGALTFTRASPRGFERVDYALGPDEGEVELHRDRAALCTHVTEWRLRFFDGEHWRGDWGWNAEEVRASEGVRGLPLAVEVEMRAGDGVLRHRVVPVMAAVIDRWMP